MAVGGYLKLFRKITNWEWYDDVFVKHVFLDLLIKANYKDKEWHGILIKRGQFLTSRRQYAKELHITEQKLRGILSKLEMTNEIKIQTTRQYTLITIVNFDVYQDEKEKVTHEQPTNDTQNNPSTTHEITQTTTHEIKMESIENSAIEEDEKEKVTHKTTQVKTEKQPSNSSENNPNIRNNNINNNNILLNYTKLNLLFNYLIYKENNFETLTESDRTAIIYRLKQLDLYFDFKDTTCFKYMTDPEEKIFEIKLYYWVITSIWISEYRMYFNNLNRNNFFFRFIKCKKYIPINSKSSEEELRHFVSYFMKSLMDELKKD